MSTSTSIGTAVSASTPFEREWESIISYENRGEGYHTSRWRLAGIRTKEAGQNTDDGMLWLQMTNVANTVTANLYKDDGLAAGNKVATGTASVAAVDGSGENAVELTVAASNSSGISGSFWIHDWVADKNCPIKVAMCVDEDLDALYDGCSGLEGYDSTAGLAEYIRIAGEDVLAAVAKIYRDQLGGHGAAEAWFITDATRSYPDLRRIANPDQLRRACAHRALQVALGREHQRATDTMFSTLRDYHEQQYLQALASLSLAFKSGSGDNAEENKGPLTIRLERV